MPTTRPDSSRRRRGSIARRCPDRIGHAQRLVGRRTPGDQAEHGDRRRQHQQRARLGLGDGLGRADPHAVHELGVVVGAVLARRRDGEEEARVEAARRLTDRRHPVGDVADRAEVEDEPVPPAQLLHRQLAGVDGTAGGVVDGRRTTVAASGQQHSGFLVALAYGGNPEGQSAGVDAEAGGRGGVVQAVAERGDRRRAIDVVDAAAGEHVHPGSERRRRRAPQHEHLDPLRVGIADEHDGRRRARSARRQWVEVCSRSGDATGAPGAGRRRTYT